MGKKSRAICCSAFSNSFITQFYLVVVVKRRDAFDGQDVLTPGFGWNIAQIQGFLMESDLWTVMDHLQ
jgi:hypothetical protein